MKETLVDLKNRRSCRKYLAQQIEEEKLSAILEAGTYAPTGMGRQSPVIVVVQKPELLEKISRLNAAVMGSAGDPFYGAPTLLIVLADPQIPTYLYDGALVMAGNVWPEASPGRCWTLRDERLLWSRWPPSWTASSPGGAGVSSSRSLTATAPPMPEC